MAAQVNRLSTTADNIANSGTTGYKRSRAEFSTLVLSGAPGTYNSGGVTTSVQTAVSSQGMLTSTTSITDLAVSGDGFFVVQSPAGTPYMTRAGAFVPNANGELVNAAGFKLMAYDLSNGPATPTANGFDGLSPVRIVGGDVTAKPSRNGEFAANLPADAEAVGAADLPSANAATASYSEKSSLVTYDNLGHKVMVDLYSTKVADNSWEVTVFDKSQAAAGSNPFPYGSAALATVTLDFDPTNGHLAAGSGDTLSIAIPGGQTLAIDLSNMTQLASDYSVMEAKVDGSAPSGVSLVQITKDGTIFAQNDDGSSRALYRIPLATTPSPDRMLIEKGNVYTPSADSGAVRIGFANDSGFGAVSSGQLENSDVDVAEELTGMIESQRSYTANSKVFQTGSELMDIVVNLKR